MTTSLSYGECSATLLRPLSPARTEGPSRVVAVSGGIGSGKSTVTAAFASLGAIVADADAIAREIMEPGHSTLTEVAARFGADLIRPDGTLDRAGLARRVFAGENANERVAERFDAVVIVDAPIEARIARLEGRGVSPEDARARIRAQASSRQRRAIAHVWIDNCGSAEDLRQVASRVWQRWLIADL